MDEKESYAFWDLIAEGAHEPWHQTLRAGSWKRFQQEEKNKNIYLFGCNEACRDFLHRYRDSFRIRGILDNAPMKWNTEFEGLPVLNPNQFVPELSIQNDVIIISMRRNVDEVASQLDGFMFQDYYGLGVLISGMEPYKQWAEQLREWKTKSPPEDIVMMESTNDFDGNSGAVYEYLKERESRHKFVWVVKEEGSKSRLTDSGDIALCPGSSIEDLKQYMYYRSVSMWQIWDNTPIPKVRPDQINVFLQHFGMGYKKIASVYHAPEYVDYVLTTNKTVYELEKDSLLYAGDTQVIFGELPRNDVLFSDEWDELCKITPNPYKKVIMWAPTLRESKQNGRIDSDRKYPFGISVIYTEEEMRYLDAFLKDRNMLLLIKLHPRQRYDGVKQKYTNILYLDGKAAKQVHTYKLLTQVDAMISDYSSIVFDYMLLNRPIAWALDDMKDYRIPFLVENPLELMPGEKLCCLKDLLIFLGHVYRNEDFYKQERNIVSEKYNAPMKGKGCENIVQALGL